MAAPTHRWRLTGLLILATVLGTGCNLPTLCYFLLNPDPKQDARLKRLADDADDDKEIKVVILANVPPDIRPEFIRVDRELGSLLAQHLGAGFKENKENVTIVPPRKVERYKDDHPDWKAMEPIDIGKHFEADYVIYLDVHELSMYERGSGNLMYRGRTDMTVLLYDVHKPDEDPVKQPFQKDFPTGSKGPIPIDDMSVSTFRQSFLDYLTKQLAWFFTEHSMSQEFSCE